MKRIFALGLAAVMTLGLLPVRASAAPAEVTAPSAVLMEKTTGQIL